MLTRRRLLTLTAASLAAPALARGAAPLRTFSGRAFGTAWQVSLPAGRDAESLRVSLGRLLAEVDAAQSPWRADSAITAFNRSKAGRHDLPSETVHVARAALDLAKASDGAFDPTVGPFVGRYGFGPILTGQPGWDALKVGERSIAKPRAELTLDLCGIAKGRALDRMVMLLADRGHDDLLIDLGGELAALGRHPEGRAWQIGVEDPRPGAEGLAARLVLDGMAVATSGGKTQSYTLNGRRYSHIIDPETGAPVGDGPASVTVVASTAMMADGWATALAAAGNEGPGLAGDMGIAALFLFEDGTGLRPVQTGAVANHLVERPWN